MPRQFKGVNFGDQAIITGNAPKARTVCRVSLDELPEEVREQWGMSPMQWTVTARVPGGVVYAAVDTPPVYVTLTIIQGHGGTSNKRDVNCTGFVKTTGAGSYIEVQARFTDANGQTVTGLTEKTFATVDVSICPGTDNEAEPQLFWLPTRHALLSAAVQLPNGTAAAPSARMGEQRLRRVRVSQSSDAGGVLFLQTFDKASSTPPLANDVPFSSDPVAQTTGAVAGGLDLDWGHQGIPFSRSLWLALSTTQDILTFPAGGGWHYQGQLYRLDSGDGT